MIAFQSMLVQAALEAGMKVSEDVEEDPKEYPDYPHFDVFSKTQLCRRMTSPGEHWGNAVVTVAQRVTINSSQGEECCYSEVTLEEVKEMMK